MRTTQGTQAHKRRKQSQSRVAFPQSVKCDIVAVGKRRDGGIRYWCLRHSADATAKYGRRAKSCRAAHLKADLEKPFELDVDSFQGGIALWGAVPPVYDTTVLPSDNGIHVHGRRSANDKKEIDETFSTVRILGCALPSGGLQVSAVDAIYYMVSSVFGFEMTQVLCTHCGAPHLDRDWFSVHPHGRHLCAACGKHFSDAVRGIGNPIRGFQDAFGMRPHKTTSANRPLDILQSAFPGGIQIWGSNPALFWTSVADEEEGIHVHAYRRPSSVPDIDDTFSEVTIDGVRLDPVAVRVLMAQNTLPHLKGRVKSMVCGRCGESLFSTGDLAFTPVAEHTCKGCGGIVRSFGRLRKTIANPLPRVFADLAHGAPRAPQSVTLDLLPETP